MISRLATLLGTADGYDRVRVYQYNGGTDRAASVAIAGITGGTGQNSRAAEYQQAMVISLKTATAGRSGRGRMYLPCAPSVATNGLFTNSLVDSGVTAIGDLFGYIKNNFSANAGRAVVWSHTQDAVYPVTSVQGDNKPDVQRRRAGRIQSSYTKTYTGL
jgi:hypothetical protein